MPAMQVNFEPKFPRVEETKKKKIFIRWCFFLCCPWRQRRRHKEHRCVSRKRNKIPIKSV
jgi:hypothetical protein